MLMTSGMSFVLSVTSRASEHLPLPRLHGSRLAEQIGRPILLGLFLLSLHILPHRLLATQQGHGVLPAVVPSPAMAGVVGAKLFGLPPVAAGSFADQWVGAAGHLRD